MTNRLKWALALLLLAVGTSFVVTTMRQDTWRMREIHGVRCITGPSAISCDWEAARR